MRFKDVVWILNRKLLVYIKVFKNLLLIMRYIIYETK
jgi:hypothetical protein